MSKISTSFYTWNGTDLTINVLGTAGAKNDTFGKVVGDKLKISVKKQAENGEATKYMIKFIAKSFGVSTKDVDLLYGETSSNKAFKIKSPKIIPKELSDIIKT